MPALAGTVSLWRSAAKGSRERVLWERAATGLLVLVGVTTFFHLPANVWVWSGERSDLGLTALLVAWLGLHVLRIAGPLAATVLALRAVRQGRAAGDVATQAV